MYKLKLLVGDSSFEGHQQTETFHFLSNRSSTEISELIKKSNQLTGIDFESLFSDYEENTLSEENISTLEENGIDFSKVIVNYHSHTFEKFSQERSNFDFWRPDAVNLFIEYLKLSDSELVINIVKDESEIINISLGYGLFNF
jgi:hypothetical protein